MKIELNGENMTISELTSVINELSIIRDEKIEEQCKEQRFNLNASLSNILARCALISQQGLETIFVITKESGRCYEISYEDMRSFSIEVKPSRQENVIQ